MIGEDGVGARQPVEPGDGPSVAAVQPLIIGEEDQRSVVAAFEKWDLKRNGYISESELKHVLSSLGIETSQVHLMFREVDMNRDGKIDYNEFVRWLYGSAPVLVRKTALAPCFELRVMDIFLELEDDPSFAGWFSDATSIRPFVRWRDLFTEKVICESPEGIGLKSRIPLSDARTPLVFDIVDEGHQAVALEVCLHRTMRSDKVLGVGQLPLVAVADAIAQGKGSADRIVVEVFCERMEQVELPPEAAAAPAVAPATASEVAPADATNVVSPSDGPAADGTTQSPPPKTKPPKKNTKKAKVLVKAGTVTLSLVQSQADDKMWAKRKVACWKQSGLPPLCGLADVHLVFKCLVVQPEQNLEFSLMQCAEALALNRVEYYASKRPEDADTILKDIEQWLAQMEETARQSDEVYRRTAARLAETGDSVASSVLTACLAGSTSQHQLMRHALRFASKVDPCVPELQQVEAKFKMILKFPDKMKLSDLLMASEKDMARVEPASLGLEIATDGASLQRVDQKKRYGVRDETAQRVLDMLGCKKKLGNFERLAMERIIDKDFQPSEQLAALGAKAIAFPGEEPATKRSIRAAVASRERDWEALIGRFDIVALPCRAEYDVGFNALPTDKMPFGFFGQDRREPIGGKGWFWTLHAAAINIGENTHADDFKEYSMPADIGYRGRHGHSRWLDEDRYVHDMGVLWKRSLQAAAALNIEDMVTFPFGMGAFLRNLHQLDGRYRDPFCMRRLKFRVAQGLFDAAAEVCARCAPIMRLHVCLVDGGLESRMNHNVFVEAAGEKVKEVPDLAPLLKFHRNMDALELSNSLASAIPASRSDLDDEVRKVGLLNGANNKLLGNHWFSNGAMNAIDENLHRRSSSMCVGSLLVNLSTAPLRRSFQELVSNVELIGGKSMELLPYPVRAKSVRAPSRILAQVEVVPYSVLGTQMTKSRQMARKAPQPDSNTVFVDPAGLPYIQSSPGGAGGASGQIYKFLGISYDPSFPRDVQEAITEPLQAKFHTYGDKSVIHVVGPNFQGRSDCTIEDALEELSQAYASALDEFASCPVRRLRLLPISSSIFAGPFLKDMPELTAKALQQGFEVLSPEQQDRVLNADRLEMCIFSEAELADFEESFRAG